MKCLVMSDVLKCSNDMVKMFSEWRGYCRFSGAYVLVENGKIKV